MQHYHQFPHTAPINSDLANGQIQFDIQDGKGFYRAVGADTWIPFKSAIEIKNWSVWTGSSAGSNFSVDLTDYKQVIFKNIQGESEYDRFSGPDGVWHYILGENLKGKDMTFNVSALSGVQPIVRDVVATNRVGFSSIIIQ